MRSRVRLADTQAIAYMLAVPPATIRQWARRYPAELPRHGHHRRRTLYDVDDALRIAGRLHRLPPCHNAAAMSHLDRTTSTP